MKIGKIKAHATRFVEGRIEKRSFSELRKAAKWIGRHPGRVCGLSIKFGDGIRVDCFYAFLYAKGRRSKLNKHNDPTTERWNKWEARVQAEHRDSM